MRKNKINLLVVIRHPVGGIRTYLKYTYKHLDPGKYQLTVLTVRNPEGSQIQTDLGGFDIRMVEVDNQQAELRLVLEMVKLLSTNTYDLIHSQGFTAGALSVVGNACFGVPHVLTSHDVLREDQFGKTAFGQIKRRLFGQLLGRADVIQSVSHDAEANLLEYFPGLSGGKPLLRVILNGIDVDAFASGMGQGSNGVLRRDLGIAEGAVLFGFLGRFMPQKGFEYLVDAVDMIAKDDKYGKRLKVLAVNDGAYIREYKALIDSKRLSEYFMFHGFVPDVRTILEGIDALVMPSLWEAYGLIAAEALLIGCPVIASDCIGLREVTRGTPALTVRTKDATSLADAMIRFMANPVTIRLETKRYMQEARTRYDSRKTAAQLDALFDETIERRCRR
ncbi:MAG: D-inositol 3-phosphate glycosyltransferase [Syntrophus sp. PtaU1.Bin208]|nr:MAG: D-inositol 3-phosphate glycosyltransferase [Syntrophus sp. PtaU1.Bin208]